MSIYEQLISVDGATADSLANDYAKRYDGTIMLVTYGKHIKSPMYIKCRGHSLILATEHVEDTLQFDGRTNDVQIEAFLPKVGYYNVGNQAINLYKYPQRQWRRSFCNSIYRAGSVNNSLPRANDHSFFTMAQAILNPVYVPMDKVAHPLFGNVALSRWYAIARVRKESFLTYRGCSVGSLCFDTGEITALHSTFQQEIQDFLNRNGVKVWKLKVT